MTDPKSFWDKYRDWFFAAAVLLGWGINYGALTTRLQNDEAQLAETRAYVQGSLVPRSEQTLSNAEIKDQLKTVQQSLDTIENEIFQIQQKDMAR